MEHNFHSKDTVHSLKAQYQKEHWEKKMPKVSKNTVITRHYDLRSPKSY